jgi:hypothetical protein
MITANQITRAAFLNTQQLEQILRRAHPQDHCLTSRFLGITNGREFAYQITYVDDGEETQGKVFVSFDSQNQLQADY